MKRSAFALAGVLAVPPLAAQPAADQEAGMVVYPAGGDYETVKDLLQAAIEGQGLLVRSTSHISDMLNRTGKDLGIEKEVFRQAESLEFCSAALSHKMVAIDPSNLTTCPLVVSVYVLTGQPDRVHVAFQRVELAGSGPEKDAVEKELFELLDGLVREATD